MGVLGEYHAAMGRLILEHEGTLERFTGDGMMVFFNDPVPIPDPALRAVRMALAMQRRGRASSPRTGRSAATSSASGIGIAQGYATIGAHRLRGPHRLRRDRHRHQHDVEDLLAELDHALHHRASRR